MIEQLFGSKTRVKLLRLFYSNPNRPFYVREITRKIDEQINSVRRELGNLLSIGIISSDDASNRLYYEVDQKYQYYKPLSEIFGEPVATEEEVVKEGKKEPILVKQKVDPVTTELTHVGHIIYAVFTGQFTRDEASGIDMLVVGDVNQTQMQKFVASLEEKEKKEIRFVVMQPSEFTYRLQVKDRFISAVMASKKQVLIDKREKEDK